MKLEVFHFYGAESRSYEEIWRFQQDRVKDIVSGGATESLIFCEHEAVITKGRRTQNGNILDQTGLPVFDIERGGDVTPHSPGQLVIYPLIKLQGGEFKGGLHTFLRFCEQLIIDYLLNLDLKAGRFGPTGVWVEDSKNQIKKMASLGIAVRRWVTYHGISLNISNDLSLFDKIRPCNFDSSIMTSMKNESVNLNLKRVAKELESIFLSRFEAQKSDLPMNLGVVKTAACNHL